MSFAPMFTHCASAAIPPFLRDMLTRYPPKSTCVRVKAVQNRFFGSNVTVSGLVTGNDLTAALKDEPETHVLITECMLRNERDRFLDDIGFEDVKRVLGKKIISVGRHGADLYDALCDARDEILEDMK